MQAHIKLGRIAGIEIGLHASWFLIALLIWFSLTVHFRATYQLWTRAAVLGAASVTVLLFFATLVAHELAHALVARANRLPIRSITLFALGGVARIEREAARATTEFWMGIAGPLTSAAIGGLCLLLVHLLRATEAHAPAATGLAVLRWLGYMNLGLAVFNMLPGFPLDGGRVLRAIVWRTTGSASRATRIAAHVGQVMAFALILIGVARFFGGAGFAALWLALIGWFLLDAARASLAQVEIGARSKGVHTADVMERDYPTVDAATTLDDLVEERLLRTPQRAFIVLEGAAPAGLLTPRDIVSVPRERWRDCRVRDVMRPLSMLQTAGPDTPVEEVLEAMSREGVNQLPVLEDGRLTGIVTRADVLSLLKTRAELSI